jgi:hypothetical protein
MQVVTATAEEFICRLKNRSPNKIFPVLTKPKSKRNISCADKARSALFAKNGWTRGLASK